MVGQEIVPGLFVSGMGVARDRELLRSHGITHVVSLMPDSRCIFDVSNTFSLFRDDAKLCPGVLHRLDYFLLQDIEYLIVPAEDAPTFAIHQHFRNCNSFIHSARKNGGKVLIHW